MCFFKDRRSDKPRLAKKAIKVYKVLKLGNIEAILSRKPVEPVFISPFKGELYSSFDIKTARFDPRDFDTPKGFVSPWSVNQGLHAYTSFSRALVGISNHFNYGRGPFYIATMIIPKGAYYMRSSHGETVSDVLITGDLTEAKFIRL